MIDRLGPLEVCCDAPSYAVVQACRRIGIQSPEDVRWCHRSQVRRRPARVPGGLPGLVGALLLAAILPRGNRLVGGLAGLLGGALMDPGGSNQSACNCGRDPVELRRFTFTFNTGREATYCLGQCPHCRTVLWEEA